MSRPDYSVVMPFMGTTEAARAAIDALQGLGARPGDELILVDNAGTASSAGRGGGGSEPRVTIVRAVDEPSPAYARNAGAAQATNDWILFLDADTEPAPGLLDALWGEGIDDDVGAVAGEIVPAEGDGTVVARYGSARSFLGQQAHQEHPFRPRAAAANLLVRRATFEQLGGFYEGTRAAEDTDFTWRLQDAGWRLALRREARVGHRYRTTLPELRRQWRGYAAGRAWLARRYEGFAPEPALWRAMRRLPAAVSRRSPEPLRRASASVTGRADRGRFLLLDAVLAIDELVGLGLSNRPARTTREPSRPTVVLVADRFPSPGDPLVELARSLGRARVEAVARPHAVDTLAARRLAVDYIEDDGRLARWLATVELIARHPGRALLDVIRRAPGEPGLRVLAPAALRLVRDRGARMQVLGGGQAEAIARRLGRLTGRSLE
ncbi:MAG TPA: glycosyltransferase [Solirubrobacteraceae bacterium]|nr:glycosyltransferase [Solirubrobacteraceae bacterium]